jgi:acetylglutamate/LysW-gamma-L-alpha-aminoadipate kinase
MALHRAGVNAVGLSGLDGSLAVAERKKQLMIVDERGRRRIIEGGYTGRITKVNTGLLTLLVDNGYTPVIAPVAIGMESEPLNTDGDRMAANVAGALKADLLILLTDVKGVELDKKIVPKMNVLEAKDAIPRIGHGMITKIYAAIEAIEQGVIRATITSGLEPSAISLSIEGRCGTVIER